MEDGILACIVIFLFISALDICVSGAFVVFVILSESPNMVFVILSEAKNLCLTVILSEAKNLKTNCL